MGKSCALSFEDNTYPQVFVLTPINQKKNYSKKAFSLAEEGFPTK